jgi:hypothetical protein
MHNAPAARATTPLPLPIFLLAATPAHSTSSTHSTILIALAIFNQKLTLQIPKTPAPSINHIPKKTSKTQKLQNTQIPAIA